MKTNKIPEAVSIIGLGPMGRAMAKAFLEKDHPVTVWNRTATKADALVTKGSPCRNCAGCVSSQQIGAPEPDRL